MTSCQKNYSFSSFYVCVVIEKPKNYSHDIDSSILKILFDTYIFDIVDALQDIESSRRVRLMHVLYEL